MNKILVGLVLLNSAWALNGDDQSWVDWKKNFYQDKLFSDGKSEQQAYLNFKENEQEVKEHNANPSRTYNQGLNKFSIFDSQTFVKKFCGTRPPPSQSIVFGLSLNEINITGPGGDWEKDNLPESVDYRNFYQPIQDQGGNF